MTVSHIMATEGSGATPATPETVEAGLADSGNPWRDAAILLGRRARGQFRMIVAAGLVCGALAGMAKLVLPTAYKASAQILIDPQEFRSFDVDAPVSTLEANAAINYVESQMGVIGSERVLLRVIREMGLAGVAPAAPQGAEAAAETPEARRARELAENKALLVLQKTVAITRAERSFLVNIAASDKSPELAAELANAVVKAYGDVNAIDRMAAARRLAADLNARVEDTRRQLGDAETRLLNFRIEHNLVGMNDKAIAERRISETTDALTASENREAQARARLKQLESAPKDVGAVPAFGPDPESRQLQLLVESRTAARNELEQLQGTLGDLHPAVVAAKSRLRDIDRRLDQALDGLRRSTRAQLAEAQGQAAALSNRLADFSAETTRAREFEPQIQEMQADIEAKRKSLTVLQTRWRDADDMSRREAPNFRIISPARTPTAKNRLVGAALWTVAGGVVGAALAFGGLAIAAMFEAPIPGVAPTADEIGDAAPKARPDAAETAPEDADERAIACLGDLPMIEPAVGKAGDALLREVRTRPDSAFSTTVSAIYRRLIEESRKGGDVEDDHPLVVLVAATWPQAGASTLAANLARVAAAEGARTLLIDAHAAHPAQDRTISPNAPKTLIKLAGRIRPLVRLTPFSQSLSLIPSWADEDRICAEIANESPYHPVAGVHGQFDFIVLDGPDASDEDGLRALAAAADQILLVVSREPGDEEDAPRLLARIGAAGEGFAAFVRAAPQTGGMESEAA